MGFMIKTLKCCFQVSWKNLRKAWQLMKKKLKNSEERRKRNWRFAFANHYFFSFCIQFKGHRIVFNTMVLLPATCMPRIHCTLKFSDCGSQLVKDDQCQHQSIHFSELAFCAWSTNTQRNISTGWGIFEESAQYQWIVSKPLVNYMY